MKVEGGREEEGGEGRGRETSQHLLLSPPVPFFVAPSPYPFWSPLPRLDPPLLPPSSRLLESSLFFFGAFSHSPFWSLSHFLEPPPPPPLKEQKMSSKEVVRIRPPECQNYVSVSGFYTIGLRVSRYRTSEKVLSADKGKVGIKSRCHIFQGHVAPLKNSGQKGSIAKRQSKL